MSNINYGCQTYPWQMNINKFQGDVPHMVDIIVQAGFTGIEAEICMLGEYYKDWQKLKSLLDEKGVVFAALAIHEDWLQQEETTEEYDRMEESIQFLSHFPTAKLLLCHVAADPIREHLLYEKQMNQMSCIKKIARRASEQGIVTAYHPNSGPSSIFRYENDYSIMFDTLYKYGIGYAPDIGHMMNGNIDPLKVIKENREIIRHVHFKDMHADHTWATMGQGVGDFKNIVTFLKKTDYRGWILVEDESPDAVENSDKVVLEDGKYIDRIK